MNGEVDESRIDLYVHQQFHNTNAAADADDDDGDNDAIPLYISADSIICCGKPPKTWSDIKK